MKPILAVVLLCSSLGARADIDWRLSIKLIANEDGLVDTNWAPNILEQVAQANQILHRSGRGYGFDVTEVVTLTGIPQWSWVSVNESTMNDLSAAARGQPALYGYRTDALNVYITANICVRSCQFADAAGEILLMSGNSPNASFFHLSGHFFNLRHTFAGQFFRNDNGSDCGIGCDCPRQFPGEADGTIETAPDNQCYTSADVIARGAYNLPFVDLDAVRQERVENSFFNVMSLREGTERLTSDQLDFMISDSNTRRRAVGTGITWFVSRDGSDAGTGKTSNSQFQTVGQAFAVADSRDMVLFRAGTYTTPQTINQPVTFRASRGDTRLVRP